ncbi:MULTISPECIES: hypothetical protein [unclassified Streptomyces]|uniref:hypothetical protein n=1 Tax=unclassified Streptomyces TaxID=2593676 RepID=UPI0033AC7304
MSSRAAAFSARWARTTIGQLSEIEPGMTPLLLDQLHGIEERIARRRAPGSR